MSAGPDTVCLICHANGMPLAVCSDKTVAKKVCRSIAERTIIKETDVVNMGIAQLWSRGSGRLNWEKPEIGRL